MERTGNKSCDFMMPQIADNVVEKNDGRNRPRVTFENGEDERNNNNLPNETLSSQEKSTKVNFALNLETLRENSEVKVIDEHETGMKDDNTPDEMCESPMSESETSSLVSSPRTPHSPQNFPMPFDEESDLAKFNRASSLPKPDVTGIGRRGSIRNRRSGFAFHLGDKAVPANAFVNTEEEPEVPKMLSVAEMMMKLNAESKSQSGIVSERISRKPSRFYSWDCATKLGGGDKVNASDRLNVQRFSLVGMRQMSSSEIEEDLKFLHFQKEDRNLDLTLFEKFSLIWYQKRGRFVAGLVFGVFLAIMYRIALAVYLFLFGS